MRETVGRTRGFGVKVVVGVGGVRDVSPVPLPRSSHYLWVSPAVMEKIARPTDGCAVRKCGPLAKVRH